MRVEVKKKCLETIVENTNGEEKRNIQRIRNRPSAVRTMLTTSEKYWMRRIFQQEKSAFSRSLICRVPMDWLGKGSG